MASSAPASEIGGLSDEELLALVRAGDEIAFATLMRRHEDLVFHLAAQMLGDRETARDLTQDLFVHLWEHPGSWKPTAKFSTWLYRVTYNRALNALRFRRLRSFLTHSEPAPPDIYETPSDSSPMEDILDAERQERFRRVFRSLPVRQRAALHLRYREDLSISGVAAALKVSYKSAEALIFRGKTALKKALREDLN